MRYLYTKKDFDYNTYLSPHTKMNSKWIIKLNVKLKTTKPLGNIRENLCDLGLGKYSLNKTPKTI